MIKTKKELRDCLLLEVGSTSISVLEHLREKLLRNDEYYIKKYIINLRKYEYYLNNSDKGACYRVLCLYHRIIWKRLNRKCALVLHPNCIDIGLKLFHTVNTRTGIVKETKIGKNVIIRPGVILGYKGDTMRRNLVAPVVDNEVEFSWGVKAFGKIHIGRGAVLHANCVPLTNIPPYAIVVGNPAKVIGFTKTPKEIIEYEKGAYPEEDRIPLDVLEKNYQKFFLNRIKDIKKHMSC